MALAYIHSNYPGVTSSLPNGSISSTPNFQNHHIAQAPSVNLALGRTYYSNFVTNMGSAFLVNSIEYEVTASGTSTVPARARIWNGNINVQNFYSTRATSLITNVTTKNYYTFNFATSILDAAVLANGNYRFGIWVNTSANNTGIVLGTVTANAGTQLYREESPSSTAVLNKEPTSPQFASFGSKAVYCVLNYAISPSAPSVSLSFDNSGNVSGSVSNTYNGDSPITGYLYRWRISGGTWSSITQLSTSDPNFSFAGVFGSTYEVQAAAKNALTEWSGSTSHGDIAYNSITLVRNDFSVSSGTLANGIVNVGDYRQEITASTGGFTANISAQWVSSKSPSASVVAGPPGIIVSGNVTTVVSGRPTAIGKHILRITMSGTNQTTVYGYWDFQVIPNIKVFDGTNWVNAKTIKVFDGSSWVDPTSLKVFDQTTWIDPG